MKTRIFCIAVLVLLFGALAFGDSVNDPKIIVRGAQGGLVPHCPPDGCRQVGMKFSFTSPEKGAGQLFFTNASGKNWTSLKLIETGVPASAITCVQSLFLGCRVSTLKNGSVEILLSGVNRKGDNPRTGIMAGQSFVINFQCEGKSCWPKGGINFTAQALSAPEPASMALLATGLVGIFSRRKRWRNQRGV